MKRTSELIKIEKDSEPFVADFDTWLGRWVGKLYDSPRENTWVVASNLDWVHKEVIGKLCKLVTDQEEEIKKLKAEIETLKALRFGIWVEPQELPQKRPGQTDHELTGRTKSFPFYGDFSATVRTPEADGDPRVRVFDETRQMSQEDMERFLRGFRSIGSDSQGIKGSIRNEQAANDAVAKLKVARDGD